MQITMQKVYGLIKISKQQKKNKVEKFKKQETKQRFVFLDKHVITSPSKFLYSLSLISIKNLLPSIPFVHTFPSEPT